jgi:hypothetical protein
MYIRNLPVTPFLSKNICGWIKYAINAVRSKNASIAESEPGTCLCYILEWTPAAGE